MARRRILFVPVWLVVVIAITGAGVYLGYRAPAITAAVLIWTLVMVSLFMGTSTERWP